MTMEVNENIVQPGEICGSESHGVSFIPSPEEKCNFSDYLLELSEKAEVKRHGFAKIQSQVFTFNREHFYKMAKDNKQSMPDTLAQWVDSSNGIYALSISRVATTYKKPDNVDELARRGIRTTVENVSRITLGKYLSSRNNSQEFYIKKEEEDELESNTTELEGKILKDLIGHYRIYPIGDCSFFFQQDSPCALNQIKSYLKETIVDGEARSGIDRSWSYIGEEGTIFALHSEDSYLHSINFNHGPGIKIWYIIPPFAAEQVEKVGQLYAANFSSLQNCSEPLQHKVLFLPPEILRLHDIPFTRVIQRPGDYIFVQSHAYHQGINISLNVAEAINYANLSSVTEYVKYKKCSCGVNCGYVINMNPLVDVAIRSGALKILSEETEPVSSSNSSNQSDVENFPEEKEKPSKHFCLICHHLKIDFKNQVAVHYRNCKIRDQNLLEEFVGESLVEIDRHVHDSTEHKFFPEPLENNSYVSLADVGSQIRKTTTVLQNSSSSSNIISSDDDNKCIIRSEIMPSASLPLETIPVRSEKRIRKPKIIYGASPPKVAPPASVEDRLGKAKILKVIPLSFDLVPTVIDKEIDRTEVSQNSQLNATDEINGNIRKKIIRKRISASESLRNIFSIITDKEALKVIRKDSTLIQYGNYLVTKLKPKTVKLYLSWLGNFLLEAQNLDKSVISMSKIFTKKDIVFINKVLEYMKRSQLILAEIRKCARYFAKTNRRLKCTPSIKHLIQS